MTKNLITGSELLGTKPLSHIFTLRNSTFFCLAAMHMLVACHVTKNNPGTNNVAKKRPYLVIMAGQSNMVGLASKSEINDLKMPFNVRYVNFGMSTRLEIRTDKFGPEVGIGRKLAAEFPDEEFILLKYAVSGSSLYDWSPQYDAGKAKITGHSEFGALFDSLFLKFHKVSRDDQPDVLAFLWMQGERDAKFPQAGEKYLTNFSTLVNAVRKQTQSPNLPVIFGWINPPADRFPAVDMVRSAQKKVTKVISNTWLVPTDDLDKLEDKVHYSTAGQLELGNRFAKLLVKHINDRKK